MGRKQLHVVYDDFMGTWYLKYRGKNVGAANTLKDALIYAPAYAKEYGCEVKIHEQKSKKIRDSDSYGNESKVKDKVH